MDWPYISRFFYFSILPYAYCRKTFRGEGRIYGMDSAMSLFNMSRNFRLAVGLPVGEWIADTFELNFVFHLFSLIGFFGISLSALGSRAMNYQRV